MRAEAAQSACYTPCWLQAYFWQTLLRNPSTAPPLPRRLSSLPAAAPVRSVRMLTSQAVAAVVEACRCVGGTSLSACMLPPCPAMKCRACCWEGELLWGPLCAVSDPILLAAALPPHLHVHVLLHPPPLPRSGAHSMHVAGCEQCTAGQGGCPDPLPVLRQLCLSSSTGSSGGGDGTPSLPQCASFATLCGEAGATFSALCSRDGATDGSSGSGSTVVPMKMYLHASMSGEQGAGGVEGSWAATPWHSR